MHTLGADEPKTVSRRPKVLVFAVVALGLAQLLVLGAEWRNFNSRHFFAYLTVVAITSVVHVNRDQRYGGFPLNLPFLLLSLVDLTVSQAVTIGCVALVIQNLRSHEAWSIKRFLLRVTYQATVISVASFVLHSLLPSGEFDPSLRLFVAAGALFAANTLPPAMIFRLSTQERLGQLWKSGYFWAFPYYLVSAALARVIQLGESAISTGTWTLVLAVLYLAYRHYRVQKQEWKAREEHAGELAALHVRAIEGLALAVEAKESLNTRGHIRRVQVYALGIGRALGLSGRDLDALQAGALLHDVGKLAVPEYILTKPGKLTPEEFAKMKVHPLVGAEIVEQMEFPYPVAPIVRAHHEKWDGGGYPFGLKGEEIPIGARILAAADWLDALISDREYRKGIPVEEAMDKIAGESGSSLDPKVVEVLRQKYRTLVPLARTQAIQGPVLSTDTAVAHGSAPDAGLDLCGLPQSVPAHGFLTTIAAAAREEHLVREIAGAGASLDLTESMMRIEGALRHEIPYESLVFFVRHANILKAEFATGANSRHLLQLAVPVGEGLTGWVGQHLQPVANGNPTVDPGFQCDPEEPLISVLALPLSTSQGLVGVLGLYRSRKAPFSRRELELGLSVAPNIATSLQNALAHREAELRANLDELTGVHNRSQFIRYLDEELARARREGRSVAVLVAEIRGYSELAKVHGYPKRDEFLVGITRDLRKASREYDRVGRLAENRIALVMPELKPADVVAVLNRVHTMANEQALRVFGIAAQLDVGGAFYPDDGEGSRNLLLVAQSKLEWESRSWEESLHALIQAGQPDPAQAEAGERRSPAQSENVPVAASTSRE
jgi:diguanylate cyclase (GGDEF)-like protein/putative nucleotidyltransferase with HDIG domain